MFPFLLPFTTLRAMRGNACVHALLGTQRSG
jgi:hypothetical protein